MKDRNKKRGGFWTVFLVLVLIAGGGVAWLLFGSDGRSLVWMRINAVIQQVTNYFQPRPVPTATPAPTPMSTPQVARATPSETAVPLPSATPPPPPDPLVWLMGHRSQWPREVTLRTDTIYPIVLNGAQVGSGNVPAGSVLTLKGITPATRTVLAAYTVYGSERQIGIDATNLLELANIARQMPPSPTPGQGAASPRSLGVCNPADAPFRPPEDRPKATPSPRFPCS